jgi:hypothetical protein
MKVLLLILFITATASSAAYAQRMRDKLFPDFQRDVTRLQKKDDTQDPRKTATDTRSLIFTNYQQSRNSMRMNRISRQAGAPAGGKLPSGISAAEARKAIPAPTSAKPPVLQQ